MSHDRDFSRSLQINRLGYSRGVGFSRWHAKRKIRGNMVRDGRGHWKLARKNTSIRQLYATTLCRRKSREFVLKFKETAGRASRRLLFSPVIKMAKPSSRNRRRSFIRATLCAAFANFHEYCILCEPFPSPGRIYIARRYEARREPVGLSVINI